MDITILHKLTYLNETKGLIKDSLNQFDAGITNEDTFRSYAGKINDIYINWRKVKDTGSDITLTPTLKGRLGSVLKGDTYQQTYIGKNLFDNNIGVKLNYSATGTKINTGMRATQTTSGTYKYFTMILPNSNNLVGKTLTLSANITPSSNNVGRIGVFRILKSTGLQDGDAIAVLNETGNVSFTMPSSLSNNYDFGFLFYSNVNGTGNVNDYVDYTNVQLEENSTSTSYEPYVGGQASPNPSYPQNIQCVEGIQNISVYGKNLFDKDDVTNGALDGDGTLIANNYYCTSNYIPVIPNTTYYKTATNSARFKYYDINKNRLSNVYNDIANAGNAQAFTTPNNAYYIRLSIDQTNGTSTYVDTLQIEKGSNATTYQAYQTPQTQEVDLGDIKLYSGDYFTGTPDNWSVVRNNGVVVLDGTEDWKTASTTWHRYYLAISDVKQKGNIFSNYFIRDIDLQDHNRELYGKIDSSYWNDGYIFIQDYNFTTKQIFTDWLSTNNTEVVYELATPTTTPITDTTLISQLNNVYKLKSYNDTTNISTSGNLPMIISASALMKGSE